jgi:hypothetical protein
MGCNIQRAGRSGKEAHGTQSKMHGRLLNRFAISHQLMLRMIRRAASTQAVRPFPFNNAYRMPEQVHVGRLM